MRIPSLILSQLFVLSWSIGTSQDAILPLSKWKDALSVRKDPRFMHFSAVLDDFNSLPHAVRCIAVAKLEEKGSSSNRRFRLRLTYLKGALDSRSDICTDEDAADALKEALRQAYEIEDPFLIAELNEFLGYHYTNHNDYNNAVLYGLIALEMEDHLGIENFGALAIHRVQLGFALYHTHDYVRCIKVSKEALDWHHDPRSLSFDSLDIPSKMYAWNTIGLCYLKLEKFDSAFLAFEKALAVNKIEKNVFWSGLIKGNIGDTYFQMGKFDSARVYLVMDIDQSLVSGEWDNAANSMQWIARMKAHEDPLEALEILRRASHYLTLRPQQAFLANTLYAYTQVYAALGKADSVNRYMQMYLAVHDELEKKVFNSREEVLRMRMENQQSVHQIIALNKERNRIILIRNFAILLTLLTGILGFLFLHRERLKMRLKQQRSVQEKLKAEAEAQSAQDQLKVFTEHLVEKTHLVESLQAQLLQKELDLPQVSEEGLTAHTILTEDDWEKFKGLFERVYPGFFNQLKYKTPDITMAELRMAALIRLQVPARKSAMILGISPNSVYKTRQRLRHRLGLETDADLTAYFELK